MAEEKGIGQKNGHQNFNRKMGLKASTVTRTVQISLVVSVLMLMAEQGEGQEYN